MMAFIGEKALNFCQGCRAGFANGIFGVGG
jgi:hypothetical protein